MTAPFAVSPIGVTRDIDLGFRHRLNDETNWCHRLLYDRRRLCAATPVDDHIRFQHVGCGDAWRRIGTQDRDEALGIGLAKGDRDERGSVHDHLGNPSPPKPSLKWVTPSRFDPRLPLE